MVRNIHGELLLHCHGDLLLHGHAERLSHNNGELFLLSDAHIVMVIFTTEFSMG
jgi:hypothetical protein